MRKSTLLWLTLAACCGVVFFHVSQKIHGSREKIAAIEAKISREEESMRILQTEWSYLNEPDRLEKLSRKYLGLSPLKGSQFAQVVEIPVKPSHADPLPLAAEGVGVSSAPSLSPSPAPREKAGVKAPRPKELARSRSMNDILKSLGVE